MSIDPTPETIMELREASPQELLTRSARKHSRLLPWEPPSAAAQERFSQAFGLD